MIYSRLLLLILTILPIILPAQDYSKQRLYEANERMPYGAPNPLAPKELNEFAFMIGACDCLSTKRNPDGSWQDTIKKVWETKYIMNGMAIQDESIFANLEQYTTSVRLYDTTENNWKVTFFSAPGPAGIPGTWTGGKSEEGIQLDMDSKAPNGMDGVSRLTFYDITKDSFNWRGEWVSEDGTIVYPFWKISCKKRED